MADLNADLLEFIKLNRAIFVLVCVVEQFHPLVIVSLAQSERFLELIKSNVSILVFVEKVEGSFELLFFDGRVGHRCSLEFAPVNATAVVSINDGKQLLEFLARLNDPTDLLKAVKELLLVQSTILV